MTVAVLDRESIFFESSSTTKYLYDNNGNLITITEKQLTGNFKNLTYSSENQLVRIDEYKNNVRVKVIEYRYDALGRRVAKNILDPANSANNWGRVYVYDGQEILAELDENLNDLAVYTHSTLRTDDVLAVDVKDTKMAVSTGSYYYLKDALGSITDIVSASSGNLVQHYVYSAFGKILKITDGSGADITNNAAVKTSYGFTSREHDSESGLMYYRARYMMPEIGRFIQEDPHPGLMSTPSTLVNKYIYVGNNPMLKIDPNGEFGIIASILIAGAISGAINMAVSGEFTLEAFGQGFVAGAVGAALVTGGAALAVWLSGAAAGSAGAAFWGAVGGAVAGGGFGYLYTGTFEGALLGAVGGGFAGYSMGVNGFGLTGKPTGHDAMSGTKTASGSVIPQKPAPPAPVQPQSPPPSYNPEPYNSRPCRSIWIEGAHSLRCN